MIITHNDKLLSEPNAQEKIPKKIKKKKARIAFFFGTFFSKKVSHKKFFTRLFVEKVYVYIYDSK